MANNLKSMQDAILVMSQQQDVIDGAVKLYGVASEQDAGAYRAMAHAALDAILDANRAKHRAQEELVRKGGK